MKSLKNIFYVAKYKKLKSYEIRRLSYAVIYFGIYFLIEYFASKYNIEFAIWDTTLTLLILGTVYVFGNYFCGKACFLSRMQDVVDIVGRIFLRSKYNNIIKPQFRKKLKWVKYIALVLTLIIPLSLRSYNVFLSIFGLCLNIGFLMCLFDSHAYCKYFCFVGALSKLSSLKNEKKLIRDPEKCIDCNICSEVCLTNCDPAKKVDPINKDLWCTSCYRCKVVCPKDAIDFK